MNEIEIVQVHWTQMENQLRQIRTRVFIQEQQVPVEMEWEAADKTCVHLLAKQGEEYIATARLLDTGQIGRMAVLKPYRRSGVGAQLLLRLIAIAETQGIETVFLHAQVDAIGFYAKYGFELVGDEFDEAGIAHQKMVRELGTLPEEK